MYAIAQFLLLHERKENDPDSRRATRKFSLPGGSHWSQRAETGSLQNLAFTFDLWRSSLLLQRKGLIPHR